MSAPLLAKDAPQNDAADSADSAKLDAPAPIVDTRPRIGSLAPYAFIYARPEPTGLALGYIRMGASVALRSDKPIAGKDCGRGWYAVEPRGYVCLNSAETTLDLTDPYFLALASLSPTADSAWHYRYAFSNGAPMYSRPPTPEEAAIEDMKFGPRGAYVQLGEWSRGHEELIESEPITATDPAPAFFAGGKRHVGGGLRSTARLVWRVIPNGSMVAYAKAFEHQGRVYLLTPDLMLVPADRVRKLRRSAFHGINLGDGIELPLAWNRAKEPKPKYKRQPGGALAPISDTMGPKTFVRVTDDPVLVNGEAYLPVRGEADTYVKAADVTVSRAAKSLPKSIKEGQKWIEVKILPGTLTAYEGQRPVYTTLFSPGKGGVPVPGYDPNRYATTALGHFPIQWKDRVATMSSEKGEPRLNWFTDVPHIQYLKPPLALHVAYWHEDFGNPKSAECVNVSPEDGRFLFNWTDPPVPEGWGGVRPGSGNGASTTVVITAR